jgi:predicted HTH transcriptional regulator
MGASSEAFLQLREQDIVTLYDATFTKKEAQKTGLNLASQIINGGEVSKHEALANLVRLNEVISNAITEIKESVIFDKVTVLGVEFTPTNGRIMYNFKEDYLWNELNNKLKQREELLKVALKSDDIIFDSDGVEVTKVTTTNSKSSLTIKF